MSEKQEKKTTVTKETGSDAGNERCRVEENEGERESIQNRGPGPGFWRRRFCRPVRPFGAAHAHGRRLAGGARSWLLCQLPPCRGISCFRQESSHISTPDPTIIHTSHRKRRAKSHWPLPTTAQSLLSKTNLVQM